MSLRSVIRLQKCLYLNVYLFITWIAVTAVLLVAKFGELDHLTKYLSGAVFTLLLLIETARLYLGKYGNLNKRVPELAGFLMLTVLMQVPLLSFFLLNPGLHNTPTEVILNSMLMFFSLAEVILGFLSLKNALEYARNLYLSQHSNR